MGRFSTVGSRMLAGVDAAENDMLEYWYIIACLLNDRQRRRIMRFGKYCKVILIWIFTVLAVALAINCFGGFDDFIVDEAHTADGKLYINLYSTNSSACITGYTYRIKEDAIQIKACAGGVLTRSPEEYSSSLLAVIPLPEKFYNKNIEIQKWGLYDRVCLKEIFIAP